MSALPLHGPELAGGQSVTASVTADDPPVTTVCLLAAAGETYAVEITRAREVRTIDDYTVVPLAPPQLIGMTNVRGAIVPILDLRRLLGLPAQGLGRAVQTLVVEADGVRVALAVDEVLGIESLTAPPATEPYRADDDAAALDGLRRGDAVVRLLDIGQLVASLA